MPPSLGCPSYGRIVPVGATKVIAAAMAAPDAGVHEESPKGRLWEKSPLENNKEYNFGIKWLIPPTDGDIVSYMISNWEI